MGSVLRVTRLHVVDGDRTGNLTQHNHLRLPNDVLVTRGGVGGEEKRRHLFFRLDLRVLEILVDFLHPTQVLWLVLTRAAHQKLRSNILPQINRASSIQFVKMVVGIVTVEMVVFTAAAAVNVAPVFDTVGDREVEALDVVLRCTAGDQKQLTSNTYVLIQRVAVVRV
jgi:hypothetical protein